MCVEGSNTLNNIPIEKHVKPWIFKSSFLPRVTIFPAFSSYHCVNKRRNFHLSFNLNHLHWFSFSIKNYEFWHLYFEQKKQPPNPIWEAYPRGTYFSRKIDFWNYDSFTLISKLSSIFKTKIFEFRSKLCLMGHHILSSRPYFLPELITIAPFADWFSVMRPSTHT